MATGNGRNNGRFAKGNSGGPGRPKLERERKYMETMTSVCTEDDWRKIVERAVKDAIKGDYRARDWLSKYLLGDAQSITALDEQHA